MKQGESPNSEGADKFLNACNQVFDLAGCLVSSPPKKVNPEKHSLFLPRSLVATGRI